MVIEFIKIHNQKAILIACLRILFSEPKKNKKCAVNLKISFCKQAHKQQQQLEENQ